MIALWYKFKYWLETKRKQKKLEKESRLKDPYIYEE